VTATRREPTSARERATDTLQRRSGIMDVSPEIAFRDVTPSEHLKSAILERIDDLEEVHGRLVSCRVMVENTTPARTSGAVYRVHVEVGVPRHSVVVNREPAGNGPPREVDQVVHEAFDIARRRLRELKKRQFGAVKTRGLPPHGRVIDLLTDDKGVRYGFLLSRDGRQIYFHENALVGLAYEELEVGAEVRFAEAGGQDGPQASTVSPLDPRKIGPRQEASIPLESRRGD
jgi:cold shock CspA family protein